MTTNMLDSLPSLELPTISKDLPGVGGELRATPDHFVVEELPLYEPAGEGQHLYVRLTKVGLTTQEVQAQLERLFGLARGAVSFAGMKDKAARTTQTFSLNVGFRPAGFADEALARIRENLPVEAHWAKFHANKLRPGHLLGNRFTITVTNLAVEIDEAMRRVKAIAAYLAMTGVPNFFGPQRFGATGTNVQQGLEVLAGRDGRKGRWLRRFLVAAVQSELCNRYLARRVEDGLFDRLLLGDIAKKHATGGMFEVMDAEVEQSRFAAHEISFTAPMYGPKMWAASGPASELEAAILATTPVTIEQLATARVEGTRRMGRLLLPELSVMPAQDDARNVVGLTVAFSLPKGAYATTVMRELMKVNPAALPEEDDDGE